MKIICPKCGADYNINDSKIPPEGLHIKCPKCLHSFVATRDGAAPLAAGAQTGQVPAVPPPPVFGDPLASTSGFAVPPPPPPAPPQRRASAPLPPVPPIASRPPAPPTGPTRAANVDVSVDLLDEIEDLDEGDGNTVAQGAGWQIRGLDGRLLGPYDAEGLRQLAAQGRLTGDEEASIDGRTWVPLSQLPGMAGLFKRTQSSGLGELDFSFSGGSHSNAEPDDFDFSFSDMPKPHVQGLVPPPPPPRPAPSTRPPASAPPPPGAPRPPTGNLTDLFDDLPEDLPAPKAPGGVDLPGPRFGGADLPAPKSTAPRGAAPAFGDDLPAPKGDVDLPGPREVSGLPGRKDVSGLPGPRGIADLPGPRGVSDLPAPRGVSDLPGQRADLPGPRGISDLPGQRADLPTRKGETGLPAPRGETGLPTPKGQSGLPGLRDGELGAGLDGEESLPGLPDDEEARAFAAEAAATVTKERKGIPRAGLLIGGGVVAAGLLAVGAMMALEIGPFGPSDERDPRSSPPSVARTKNPPSVAPNPATGPAGTSASAEPALLAPAATTLAEVAGYREAIGPLELKGEAQGDDAVRLAELYAFGGLEFRQQEWVQKAGELAGKLDANAPAGKRAALAAALAGNRAGVHEEIVAFAAKNAADARAQYLLGHAWRLKGDGAQARQAFEKAATTDAELVGARRFAGELALRGGDVAGARAHFEAVLQKAPGAPGVTNHLAAIALSEGKNDDARKLVEGVLALDKDRLAGPDRSAALTLRARLDLAAGQVEPGLAGLEEAIRAWPQNLDAVDLLSRRHFADKAYDKALAQFEALRTAGVESPEIAIRIAECHEALSREAKALEELQAAAAKFATSPVVQGAIGDLHVRQRRFAEARAAYDKSLEIDGTYEEAHLRIANLLVSQSKVSEAVDYLKAAVARRPQSATLHYGLGELQQRLADVNGDPVYRAQAEAEFRKALAADPAMSRARHQLAVSLIDVGKPEAALKELEALRSRPDYHQPLDFDFGRALHAMKRYDEAIAKLDAALAQQPENAAYLLESGITRFDKGDLDSAREQLTKAAAIDTNLTLAHFYIGRVELAAKNHSEAIRKFKMAIEEEQRNFTYRYWLGVALQDSGEADIARAEFETVAAEARKDARLAAQLCDVFFRLGQMQMGDERQLGGALRDLRSATECDPKNAVAWLSFADVHMSLGKDREAQGYYGQALKNAGTVGEEQARRAMQAVAHYRLGELAIRFEDMKGARQHFEQSREAKSDYADAWYQLCSVYAGQSDRGRAQSACKKYLELAPDGQYARAVKDIQSDL